MATPRPPRVLICTVQSYHLTHKNSLTILHSTKSETQPSPNLETAAFYLTEKEMEPARKLMKFEETELRLGLPGDRTGKRGFDETSRYSVGEVDLNLNLNFSKEALMDEIEKIKEKKNFVASKPTFADPSKPPAAKAQVVGWPPVRAFRKNMVTPPQTQKKDESSESSTVATGAAAAYVKVSMDGAPYLRKVDLRMYKSYLELSVALVKMFNAFIAGNSGPQSRGMKDFLGEKTTVNLLNGSEFVSTFEDKDGDWMLVGDVPWEMFVDSCKRLRIMKGSDAIGLAPGATEASNNKC